MRLLHARVALLQSCASLNFQPATVLVVGMQRAGQGLAFIVAAFQLGLQHSWRADHVHAGHSSAVALIRRCATARRKAMRRCVSSH